MLLLAALALLAVPAVAELIVLVGGGVLKVDEFHRDGDDMRLLLSSGGTLTLSMMRIERVLADEVEKGRFDAAAEKGLLPITFDARQPVPATPYGELIYDTARRHDLNPRLVAAMVQTESNFDPYAVSVKGATGLLQLMPATARRFGLRRDEVFDPELNLDAGARYLRWLNERFRGNLTWVLAGYNAGEASVERYRGVPPYRETHDYIRRVYRAAGVVPAGRGSE